MNQQARQRLGRGLAALIGDDTSEESVVQDVRHLRHMPIEVLHGSPNNPRKAFSDTELVDLANSIREKGLLQPIVVRPRPDGSTYEIVAGERRWRAAQKAGVHDVPVLIRELNDGEALEVALIENIQRTDLNALELHTLGDSTLQITEPATLDGVIIGSGNVRFDEPLTVSGAFSLGNNADVRALVMNTGSLSVADATMTVERMTVVGSADVTGTSVLTIPHATVSPNRLHTLSIDVGDTFTLGDGAVIELTGRGSQLLGLRADLGPKRWTSLQIQP